MPAEFQELLQSSVNDLADRVQGLCVPPPPAADEGNRGKDKGKGKGKKHDDEGDD